VLSQAKLQAVAASPDKAPQAALQRVQARPDVSIAPEKAAVETFRITG
jgi:hypothetical protein